MEVDLCGRAVNELCFDDDDDDDDAVDVDERAAAAAVTVLRAERCNIRRVRGLGNVFAQLVELHLAHNQLGQESSSSSSNNSDDRRRRSGSGGVYDTSRRVWCDGVASWIAALPPTLCVLDVSHNGLRSFLECTCGSSSSSLSRSTAATAAASAADDDTVDMSSDDAVDDDECIDAEQRLRRLRHACPLTLSLFFARARLPRLRRLCLAHNAFALTRHESDAMEVTWRRYVAHTTTEEQQQQQHKQERRDGNVCLPLQLCSAVEDVDVSGHAQLAAVNALVLAMDAATATAMTRRGCHRRDSAHTRARAQHDKDTRHSEDDACGHATCTSRLRRLCVTHSSVASMACLSALSHYAPSLQHVQLHPCPLSMALMSPSSRRTLARLVETLLPALLAEQPLARMLLQQQQEQRQQEEKRNDTGSVRSALTLAIRGLAHGCLPELDAAVASRGVVPPSRHVTWSTTTTTTRAAEEETTCRRYRAVALCTYAAALHAVMPSVLLLDGDVRVSACEEALVLAAHDVLLGGDTQADVVDACATHDEDNNNNTDEQTPQQQPCPRVDTHAVQLPPSPQTTRTTAAATTTLTTTRSPRKVAMSPHEPVEEYDDDDDSDGDSNDATAAAVVVRDTQPQRHERHDDKATSNTTTATTTTTTSAAAVNALAAMAAAAEQRTRHMRHVSAEATTTAARSGCREDDKDADHTRASTMSVSDDVGTSRTSTSVSTLTTTTMTTRTTATPPQHDTRVVVAAAHEQDDVGGGEDDDVAAAAAAQCYGEAYTALRSEATRCAAALADARARQRRVRDRVTALQSRLQHERQRVAAQGSEVTQLRTLREQLRVRVAAQEARVQQRRRDVAYGARALASVRGGSTSSTSTTTPPLVTGDDAAVTAATAAAAAAGCCCHDASRHAADATLRQLHTREAQLRRAARQLRMRIALSGIMAHTTSTTTTTRRGRGVSAATRRPLRSEVLRAEATRRRLAQQSAADPLAYTPTRFRVAAYVTPPRDVTTSTTAAATATSTATTSTAVANDKGTDTHDACTTKAAAMTVTATSAVLADTSHDANNSNSSSSNSIVDDDDDNGEDKGHAHSDGDDSIDADDASSSSSNSSNSRHDATVSTYTLDVSALSQLIDAAALLRERARRQEQHMRRRMHDDDDDDDDDDVVAELSEVRSEGDVEDSSNAVVQHVSYT